MILTTTLKEVVQAQRNNLAGRNTGLKRAALEYLPDLDSHALIVTGIRRCGKSTLLFQLLEEKYRDAFFLNFEDPRLYELGVGDFYKLDQVIADSHSRVLLFDEIQVIEGWERYARQKLDEGYKLVITGSNASLLSREPGTRLTGRHISKELFPFSWREFCAFRKTNLSEKSLLKYLQTGGFPEYIKSENSDVLHQLFEDILLRDIAVRFGIRDVKSLQRLALYLISNVGKPVTANRIKSLIDISSTSTIMEYFSHIEQSYLLHFIPKFSYSVRKQLVNPRKVYAIDTGLVNVTSGSFTDDSGSKLENLVFLHLRRTYKDIYYYSDRGECDFVVFNHGKIRETVQVCFELNRDNLDRELNGLFEALEFFDQKKGTIVTMNQTDRFERDGRVVKAVPCHEYMAQAVI